MLFSGSVLYRASASEPLFRQFLYGVLGSSGLLGQVVGQTLPTHKACPSEEPSSSASAPSRRPRNCTLSATTSTLLLLEPSWASQVRYCNLPSTRMGSPFFL